VNWEGLGGGCGAPRPGAPTREGETLSTETLAEIRRRLGLTG
jgi:hypothetical protein